jgi:hypothetical protein
MAVLGRCINSTNYSVFWRAFEIVDTVFLQPLASKWLGGYNNESFRIMLSGLYTKSTKKWLDVCFESAFITSKSPNFRPIRPLTYKIYSSTVTNRLMFLQNSSIRKVNVTLDNVRCNNSIHFI